MTLPEFVSFESIPRLKRGCTITEKIDGTNAQIYISDTGTLLAGSRNHWITPEDNNYGFARWVEENREELLKLGPGSHYGEWWGSGIQRRYGMQEKRFSLFNSSRWTPETLPVCCSVVPVLYSDVFHSTAVDQCLERLKTEGSIAGLHAEPEGVVVYLQATRKYFKATLDGDGHKGQKT